MAKKSGRHDRVIPPAEKTLLFQIKRALAEGWQASCKWLSMRREIAVKEQE